MEMNNAIPPLGPFVPYAETNDEMTAHICPTCLELVPFRGKPKDFESLPRDGIVDHQTQQHPETVRH